MNFLAHIMDLLVHDTGHFSLKHGLFCNTNRKSLHLLYCCQFFFCCVLEGCHKFLVLFRIFCLVIEAIYWIVKENILCSELVNTLHMCRSQTIGRPNRNIVVLFQILQPLKFMWVVEVCCNRSKLLNQFIALWKFTTRSNHLKHMLLF